MAVDRSVVRRLLAATRRCPAIGFTLLQRLAPAPRPKLVDDSPAQVRPLVADVPTLPLRPNPRERLGDRLLGSMRFTAQEVRQSQGSRVVGTEHEGIALSIPTHGYVGQPEDRRWDSA